MEVVNVALPCPFKVTGAPSELPPSRKVTVPVGTVEPETAETVAVNVTDCPKFDGFGEDIIVMFVAAPVDGIA